MRNHVMVLDYHVIIVISIHGPSENAFYFQIRVFGPTLFKVTNPIMSDNDQIVNPFMSSRYGVIKMALTREVVFPLQSSE